MLETLAVSIQCLHKLFHYPQLQMEWWKNDFLSTNDWVVHNVWHTCLQSFTDGPLFLSPVYFLTSAVLHAEKTWEFCETHLLSKEDIHHIQVYANTLSKYAL